MGVGRRPGKTNWDTYSTRLEKNIVGRNTTAPYMRLNKADTCGRAKNRTGDGITHKPQIKAPMPRSTGNSRANRFTSFPQCICSRLFQFPMLFPVHSLRLIDHIHSVTHSLTMRNAKCKFTEDYCIPYARNCFLIFILDTHVSG